MMNAEIKTGQFPNYNITAVLIYFYLYIRYILFANRTLLKLKVVDKLLKTPRHDIFYFLYMFIYFTLHNIHTEYVYICEHFCTFFVIIQLKITTKLQCRSTGNDFNKFSRNDSLSSTIERECQFINHFTGVLTCVVHGSHPRRLLGACIFLHGVVKLGCQRVLHVAL